MKNIPKSTQLGNNIVIEKDVILGENVSIGHNTIILNGTKIEDNVTIGCNCILGVRPIKNQRIRKDHKQTRELIIKNGTQIGHLVSVYAGTIISEGVFIGDHASIRENVSIDKETIIGRSAMVELNTTIGKRCTIQTLAYITGDTILEDDVFIGPCVSMSNDKYMGALTYKLKGPHIKTGAKIGNNAALLPGILISQNAIIGAGAVVTKQINANEIVIGNPAHIMKDSTKKLNE